MNYVERLRAKIAEQMPEHTLLVDFYTLIGLIFGSAVTEEDVHHAWAVWRNQSLPSHKDLVPFEDLSAEVQASDTKYVEIIRKAVKDSYVA